MNVVLRYVLYLSLMSIAFSLPFGDRLMCTLLFIFILPLGRASHQLRYGYALSVQYIDYSSSINGYQIKLI